MTALVEYGAERVTDDDGDDAWQPAVWLNGEPHDLPNEEEAYRYRADALADATEEAINLASEYLGRGGVTVRLRVEPATPPVLGPESTIAELSAECVRLDISEVGVWKAPRPEDGWRARVWKVAAAEPVFGHQPDPMSALLEALRRANGGL